MGRKEEIPNFWAGVPFFQQIAKGVKIAEAFRRFFVVDEKVLCMEPLINKAVVAAALPLRDLIFMGGKHVVDAAAMDVDRIAEEFGRHGRALDMPAGTARTK